MPNILQSKVALITGASRGLGRATARRLAADGAHVLIHYAASAASSAALKDEIEQAGGSAELVQADLATAAGATDFVAAVKAVLGDRRLDILVNNAGFAQFSPFESTDAALIDQHYAVNVRAPFLVTQGLLDVLADDASVIFLSSVVARNSFTDAIAYDITKGAIDTLVLQLAKLLGERGIRVNAIAPGATATDMAEFLNTEEGAQMVMSLQALKRVAQPEDIADAAAFLAGKDSRWVTGQTLSVSGGWQL
ncbi:MAG: oxidoreductase [Erythrobacter sp.]|jgi:3-oxoacyl-[acyl-carrier protein] reductase|nr:oxidoreductase [Erythrobacter sp.]